MYFILFSSNFLFELIIRKENLMKQKNIWKVLFLIKSKLIILAVHSKKELVLERVKMNGLKLS